MTSTVLKVSACRFIDVRIAKCAFQNMPDNLNMQNVYTFR